jgi:hypothetical protein
VLAATMRPSGVAPSPGSALDSIAARSTRGSGVAQPASTTAAAAMSRADKRRQELDIEFMGTIVGGGCLNLQAGRSESLGGHGLAPAD